MCEKFAVTANIIPVTDNSIETRITTNKGELHLQEYWVKHRGRDQSTRHSIHRSRKGKT